MRATTRAGSSLASAAVVRQAPAWVAAAAAINFLLSKKLRSHGAARSSGATLTIRRACAGAAGSVAPAKVAISSKARPLLCRRNTGSLIPPVPCRQPRPRSEPRAAAEAEDLRAVVALLRHGVGEIEAQRTERSIPDQAH